LAPSTTVIVAVKKAEQGEALIVRVQELAGKNTTCRLGVAGSPKPVVFLIEAYRLKTLRIEKKSGGLSIDVVNLVEQEIS